MEDYIKYNPTELIESPKIGFKLPGTLSLIEIDKLIAAIDLGFGNNDAIEEFTVELQTQYWTPLTPTSND